MLFLCGRWARHCYITSLLTLHWSINNRPIQVANNRPIYVVGCIWPSNTCKVLYFWFGGQNDLLRTMWYFIIQLILHLYNILGLVSGKFEISRLYIYWTIASWSAASLLTQRCSDHVHYGRCVGDIYLNLNLSGLSKFRPTHKKMYMPRKKNIFTFCMLFQMAHWLWPTVMSGDLINVIRTEILRFDPKIMDREFEKKMVPKIFFYIYIQKWSAAWGPHKCHRNRNPQVRSWDNGPRIWKEMVQKKFIYFFYKKIV